MRNVVLYTLLSLDGVAEEPGDWMFEADEDVFRNLAKVIGAQDDIILGRGTYDYWVGYWPTSDVQPFADFINQTTKHVATSRPLDQNWNRSTSIDAPLTTFVQNLKAGSGGDIGIHGSISVGQSLMAADLVDRLELVIVPIWAGAGRRLFEDRAAPLKLALVRATSSPTGCVFLSYQRPTSD